MEVEEYDKLVKELSRLELELLELMSKHNDPELLHKFGVWMDKRIVCKLGLLEVLTLRLNGVTKKDVFTMNQKPRVSKDTLGNDLKHSEDVIILSKDGYLNIGFWNYDTKKWLFHTDTLIDTKKEKFVWMYHSYKMDLCLK